MTRRSHRRAPRSARRARRQVGFGAAEMRRRQSCAPQAAPPASRPAGFGGAMTRSRQSRAPQQHRGKAPSPHLRACLALPLRPRPPQPRMPPRMPPRRPSALTGLGTGGAGSGQAMYPTAPRTCNRICSGFICVFAWLVTRRVWSFIWRSATSARSGTRGQGVLSVRRGGQAGKAQSIRHGGLQDAW